MATSKRKESTAKKASAKKAVKKTARKATKATKKKTAKKAPTSRSRKNASTFSQESLEKQFKKLLNIMAKPGSKVDPNDLAALETKVSAIWNYTPTICVFGQTGSGKSSLCNALFGKRKFKISAVEACTLEPQSDTVALGKKRKIRIVDMPGMGESHDKDKTYQALYEETLANADLVLWALKSDSRAFASDLNAWDLIRDKVDQLGIPVFFLLTQADKIDPSDKWNKRSKLPGSEQMGNLLLKKKKVAEDFKTSPERIVEISSATGFNLTKLVLHIILALPDEKKTALLGFTTAKVQSKSAKREAKAGFWRSVMSWCKISAKTVWEFLDENSELIGKAFNSVMTVLELKEKRGAKTKKASRKTPTKRSPPKKAVSRTRQARKPR